MVCELRGALGMNGRPAKWLIRWRWQLVFNATQTRIRSCSGNGPDSTKILERITLNKWFLVAHAVATYAYLDRR